MCLKPLRFFPPFSDTSLPLPTCSPCSKYPASLSTLDRALPTPIDTNSIWHQLKRDDALIAYRLSVMGLCRGWNGCVVCFLLVPSSFKVSVLFFLKSLLSDPRFFPLSLSFCASGTLGQTSSNHLTLIKCGLTRWVIEPFLYFVPSVSSQRRWNPFNTAPLSLFDPFSTARYIGESYPFHGCGCWHTLRIQLQGITIFVPFFIQRWTLVRFEC